MRQRVGILLGLVGMMMAGLLLIAANFKTDDFYLEDYTDNTRRLGFDLSTLTTGTRIMLGFPTIPAPSGSMVVIDNVPNQFTEIQTVTNVTEAGLDIVGSGTSEVYIYAVPTGGRIYIGGPADSSAIKIDNGTGSTTLREHATAKRSVTFPNITGELMSLAGAQTITGVKTFDQDATGVGLRFLYATDASSSPPISLYQTGGGGPFQYDITLPSALTGGGQFVLPIAGGVATTNAGTATISNKTITTLKNSSTSQGIPVVAGNGAFAPASGALAKVSLTARTAAIAATNLTNTNPAGMYRVNYYLSCTTANVTDGTISFQVNYTDLVGATTQTTATTLTLAATSTGTTALKGSFIVHKASGELSCQTNLTGAQTTGRYSIEVRTEFLGL